MTPDYNKIEKILYILKDNIEKLKDFSNMSIEEFRGDFRNYQSALRLLQISIESIIDMGSHIISRKNLEPPQIYSDIFRILENNKIIGRQCRDRCIEMVKFRNRIVHIYHEIDLDMVLKFIKEDVDDFKLFVYEISELLKG